MSSNEMNKISIILKRKNLVGTESMDLSSAKEVKNHDFEKSILGILLKYDFVTRFSETEDSY